MEIWGTSPESIDEAEDRDKWYQVLTRLDIKQPPGTMVTSEPEALDASAQLGYPVMVRPSFVLGGRAMEIVYRYGTGALACRREKSSCMTQSDLDSIIHNDVFPSTNLS